MPKSNSLRSALHSLASSFTEGVLAAVRAASIEALQAESGGRPLRGRANGAKTSKPGRLARRSAEDIAKVLDRVVALVKKSRTGLRAEEIKKGLGLDVREVPRILKAGLKMKKLTAKGQKRATVYSAR